MSAGPGREDAQLLARVRASLEDDASRSGQVDPDRVWSTVREGVPARRRRRTVRRALLAGGLAVAAVAAVGGVGGAGWLRALDGRPALPPATSTSTGLSTEELLPAPLREPRSTSTQTRAWVLPEQCTAAGSVPAELVTARDGSGSYGSVIDVTQVAQLSDGAAAASVLQQLTLALEQCAAGRPDLSVAPLDGGLTGVQVTQRGDTGGTSAEGFTAVVLAGDAVALLTTSGPTGTTTSDREQVLDRARSLAGTATAVRTG